MISIRLQREFLAAMQADIDPMLYCIYLNMFPEIMNASLYAVTSNTFREHYRAIFTMAGLSQKMLLNVGPMSGFGESARKPAIVIGKIHDSIKDNSFWYKGKDRKIYEKAREVISKRLCVDESCPLP